MNTSVNLNRRSFLRRASLGAGLGTLGMSQTFQALSLMNGYAQANPCPGPGDHKALVCIYLAGGNDSNNLIIPYGSPTTNPVRKRYETHRGVFKVDPPSSIPGVPDLGFHPGVLDRAKPNEYPVADTFNKMFQDGELACMLNVGNIFGRVANRAALTSNPYNYPRFFGSHSDATEFWHSASSGDNSSTTGWGGRVAEWIANSSDPCYNDGSTVSMSLAVGGLSPFLNGLSGSVRPFAVEAPGKVISYTDSFFNQWTKDYMGELLALNTGAATRANAPLRADYADTLTMSLTQNDGVQEAFDLGTAGVVETAFAGVTGGLADQLQAVAKLIAGNSALSHDRQIFFVAHGGYDTHKLQAGDHPALLTELAAALKAFNTALKNVGKFENVISFTASDFGRTVVPNGDGTNHAWGGHSLVMGAPGSGFQGGMYGQYPNMILNPMDADEEAVCISRDNQGRFIPQIATSEYAARLAQWFGVTDADLFSVFPELENFHTDVSSFNGMPEMQFLAPA